MQSKVDELDVNKLVPVPVDLGKLIVVVKNTFLIVKNTEHYELVNKLKAIKITDANIFFKNLTITQIFAKLKNKITDHGHSNKYITTQELNLLM